MQSDRDQSAKKAIHQTLYNIDSVLNSISSLDDEEAELEKEENNMIITSFDTLYSDSSIFNDFPIPLGVIVQPFSTNPKLLRRVDGDPIRCDHCGAVVSSADEIGDNGYWKCSFCQTLSSFSYGNGESVVGKRNELLELRPELAMDGERIEYSPSATDVNVLYSPSTDAKALIFVIDKSLTTTQFKHIQDSLSVVLSSPNLSHYYVGLIVYSETIEIYEFGGSVGEADVFPGNRMPSPIVSTSSLYVS